MATEWYLAPYDLASPPGDSPGPKRRICSVARHIPTSPHVSGARWEEAETLGNHCVVKVVGPPAIHATLAADPDIVRIPRGPDGLVPSARRNALAAKLQSLGFTVGQVTGLGWSHRDLLDALAAERHSVRWDAQRKNLVWDADDRRPSGRRISHIDRALAHG